MSSRLVVLAALLSVSALACAGREGTETSTAKQVRRDRPIELAPVIFAGNATQELAPVVCGPEEDSLPPACEAMASHPQQFPFMDDVCRSKRFPIEEERDFRCPNVASSADIHLADGRVAHYRPATEPVVVDDALAGVLPDSVKLTVILVRRVNGVPHYRYVSNGTHDQAFQPWSSTKFMAIANAAGTIRKESGGKVGLDGVVDGVPVGDLVTIVHSYDESHYSSNSLAKWFHDVGGRMRINELLHGWLKRPKYESLGGNYGPGFAGIGLKFRDNDGHTVTVPRDPGYSFDNHLSSYSMAEFLKRLVMHREDASTRMPHLEWNDLRVLFYGAESSKWFEGKPGGMSADRSVYLQLHDMDGIVKRSQGHYRILSKSGMGWAQFVHAGYACFPSLDSAGAPIADAGRELIIAARTDGPAGYVENDRTLARAYKTVVQMVLDGKI
jgi:hypothetical protein